jgi:hypothetical protein
MVSSEGLGASPLGYAYGHVRSDDSDGDIHSHPVDDIDDSDDEDDDFNLQGPEWFSVSSAIPRPACITCEWFSISLAIPRPAYCITSPTVDDRIGASASSADDVSAAAGVCATASAAQPPASIYHFATSSKRTVTTSARGESLAAVPVARGRSGSSDFCGPITAIAAVGPFPITDTFGSSGLVRGRLRKLA